jgi:hypothetical protein
MECHGALSPLLSVPCFLLVQDKADWQNQSDQQGLLLLTLTDGRRGKQSSPLLLSSSTENSSSSNNIYVYVV